MRHGATRPGSRTRSDRHVGVRELRQNLSVYLERVVAGEALAVTARGRVVAMLVPLSAHATVVERLAAAGKVIPAARHPRDLAPLAARLAPAMGRRVQRALEDLRRERV